MSRLRVIAFTCATVASLIVSASPAASAATWTAGRLTFTDTTTRTVLACTRSTAGMVPTRKTNPVANVTSISFTGCALGTITVTLTPKGLDWPIMSSRSGRTVGETSGGHGIAIGVTAAGCSADVNGSSGSTDTGVAHFSYTRKAGKLAIHLTNGNLHVYQVSGCTGLAQNGDAVSFSIIYTLD